MQSTDSMDSPYKLSFTDLQTILLKQANWLKKFYNIFTSLYAAVVAEVKEGESVIQDMKECCCKVEAVVKICAQHEKRVIGNIENHITSLLPKLKFIASSTDEMKAQKSILSQESWIKKSGIVYLIDYGADRIKRHSKALEPKIYTIIVFVSTILIVENKGAYLKVIDCISKENIKFRTEDYLNVECRESSLIFTKVHPVTRAFIKEYSLPLNDSKEKEEWTNVLTFSQKEKISQDMEYVTPLEILNAEPAYENYPRAVLERKKSIYENVEAIQVLSSIVALNQKTTNSLLKLKELYIDNIVLNSIICGGEKHHLYFNVMEVMKVIESFNNELEVNQFDSLHLFTELRKGLDEDMFYPIVKYEAHVCFQRNMLQFQRKHNTAFCQVLGNIERDPLSQWRVSEIDLKLRLAKPADWLARLYHKLKTLEGAIKNHNDVEESLQRLNAETIHQLSMLIRRKENLKESLEDNAMKHITSVLLSLPVPASNQSHLVQKLSTIQDDWIKKHDTVTLFTKRNIDSSLKSVKRRYHSTQINMYASTSVIILASSNDHKKQECFCKCYDRNYTDLEILDTRENWMPEKDFLFRLWIYEKTDKDYEQTEHIIGLKSSRSGTDLLEWKSVLVVATGESGIFDDYVRPRHIVSEPFMTDRPEELSLEVNDFVEITNMQYAMDKAWVKGTRLKDEKTGWFPRNILGHEIDSEYSRGQMVKLRFRREREQEREKSEEMNVDKVKKRSTKQ